MMAKWSTTIYSCGPAALATILKNMGIYTTESELAQIAKTDETGTSLQGLKDAANAKGINAFGYELSLAQLKPDYIVVLKINGYNHFEVIQNITNTTITLFDPNLGIIQMNLTTFNDLYTGYAFVLNETIPGAAQLTDDQMRNIKGLWHTVRTIKWRWHPGEWKTYIRVIDRSIPYPTLIWSYHRGWTMWTPWGPREIGGYWYPSGIKIKYHHIHYKIRIRYYVPGYPEKYAAYVREPDTWDIDYYKYGSTLITTTGAGLTIGAASKAITLIRGGASLSTIVSTEGAFNAGSAIYSIYGALSYTNPDPNPSGKGEGIINMIDPSWEPFLSN